MAKRLITVTFEFESDDEIAKQILTHIQRSTEDIWDPIESELEATFVDLNIVMESRES